ncbi:putative ribonuclease H-like domain-containing protein [Tanacetum coccineum]
MTKPTSEQGFLSAVYKEKTHDTLNTCLYACFLSQIEPTSIAKALSNSSWVEAMQEELLQFKLQQVWKLVDLPNGKRAIGTKWVFRNKKDERGIVIRNKVYVSQPPGFKDPDYPDKVYKVVKALYGLHQAPRAWYETLANYLLGNGFKRGKIDQTLFIKKQKEDILLVQVYVDDIIFGSTNKELCTAFEKLMKDKFQISSMRELTFFLGLQVQQKEDGIFISQDKYVVEILKKFNYTNVKSASTLVDLEKPLVKDRDTDAVDVHLYRSMSGSLMYLIASRLDIMFAVCACARFQVTPKTSHLYAIKRIFRYLKGKPTLGLWKSTTGGCQFLGNRLISWQCKKQTVVATSTTEAEYVAIANLLTKGFDAGRHVKRGRDTKIPQSSGPPVKVGDEAVHKKQSRIVMLKLGLRLHLNKTSRHVKRGRDTRYLSPSGPPVSAKSTAWNEFSSTMASEIICLATNQKFNLSKYIIDAMLGDMSHHKKIYFNPSHIKKIFVNMKREGKDFSGRVTPLFATMMVQATQDEGVDSAREKEIKNYKEDASKQGRIKIVDETQGRLDDAEMFDTDDLHGDEVIVDMGVGEKQEKSAKFDKREGSTGVEDSAAPTIPVTTADEGVTAAMIDEITPTSAPQEEPSEFRTTTSSPQASQPSKTKDKGKAIMIEPEVPLKRKDQVALDEEMARNPEA